MKALADCYLYTFVDTSYLRGRSAVDLARQLCEGGSDIIQLRAKEAGEDEVRRLAEAIAPVTDHAGVQLVINDHPNVAKSLVRALCHLGQEDFFLSGWTHVSQLGGGDQDEDPSQMVTCRRRLRVGLSTHSPHQAMRAITAGADYIAVGPVFPTPTKPEAEPVTTEYVRWAAANVRIPWFAIGGITLERMDELRQAGAKRICVVSEILNARDVVQTCQAFRERIFSGPS
jgi:thiamine-phosphate pyrophosphorylase